MFVKQARLVIVLMLAAPVMAADAEPETCEQIRAKIGVATMADADLLRTLAARKDCGFTAREVYRAAYGDSPWPPSEARDHSRHNNPARHKHDDDRDDD